MTAVAIALLCISAVTHASWNLLGKQKSARPQYLFHANLAGSALILPLIFVYHAQALIIFQAVWPLLLLSGLSQSLYFIGLINAYKSGHLSMTYPLARAMPVVFVVFVSILLGHASELSAMLLCGVAVILLGSLIIPMQSFSDFRLANYRSHAFTYALVAALGTAGYTLSDDAALDILRSSSDLEISTTRISFIYLAFEALGTTLCLTLYFAVTMPRAMARTESWRSALLPGIAIYGTYALVLISMAYVTNVSYVVAFRQLSIPLGAIMGMTVLHEDRPIPKLCGICLMFLGLLLVAAG